jgi:hypothetical protein
MKNELDKKPFFENPLVMGKKVDKGLEVDDPLVI